MNRRQLFRSIAVSSTALLAGCSAYENLEEASESGTSQGNPNTQSPGNDPETDLDADIPEYDPQTDSNTQTTEDEPIVAEDTGPSVEVLELLQSESRLVSSDNPSTGTFTATAQNTGQSGNIAIALFWQTQEFGKKPNSVDSMGLDAYKREQKKEVFFNSSERRTITFTAIPPADALGYYFFAQPATYGANIRNTGEGGRVTVTMDYERAMLGLESTDEETVYIGENSIKEVLFDVNVEQNTEWEITAEPAN